MTKQLLTSEFRSKLSSILFMRIAAGMPVSVRLQELAYKHGIQIEAIEDAALASASLFKGEDFE